jgi:N-acetylmuramoyl-L-alanine amidase
MARRWILAWLLAAFCAVQAAAAPVRLSALALGDNEVTVTAGGPLAGASVFALATPYRLVVDFPGAVADAQSVPGAGRVAGLRLAMFDPDTARLVIELSAPAEIASTERHGDTLALRLRAAGETGFASAIKRGRKPLAIASAPAAFELPADLFPPRSKPAPAPPPPAAPDAVADASPPPGAPVRPRSGGAKPLVVIDAGHGGKDVGAIAVDGGYEKDVTLAIAQATARALRRDGRIAVKLTRGTDIFIPLGGRVAIARQARADLFVSIHADSAPNPDARGASVYTLSAVASDAVAARLAARENKADIIGGVNLGVEAPDVGDILIDLSRRATNNVSVAFAEKLQDQLSDRIPFRSEFHHFAGFYVLKAPDVPSVLLETGYVTNADDAKTLFSDDGRERIAEGIATAIKHHLLGAAAITAP